MRRPERQRRTATKIRSAEGVVFPRTQRFNWYVSFRSEAATSWGTDDE